ncbi:MAG: hypothetical protein JWO53_82 [Chlamydiia bacterium]|nr:hypothetical protein [Chlamydiia bacterium]
MNTFRFISPEKRLLTSFEPKYGKRYIDTPSTSKLTHFISPAISKEKRDHRVWEVRYKKVQAQQVLAEAMKREEARRAEEVARAEAVKIIEAKCDTYIIFTLSMKINWHSPGGKDLFTACSKKVDEIKRAALEKVSSNTPSLIFLHIALALDTISTGLTRPEYKALLN